MLAVTSLGLDAKSKGALFYYFAKERKMRRLGPPP